MTLQADVFQCLLAAQRGMQHPSPPMTISWFRIEGAHGACSLGLYKVDGLGPAWSLSNLCEASCHKGFWVFLWESGACVHGGLGDISHLSHLGHAGFV